MKLLHATLAFLLFTALLAAGPLCLMYTKHTAWLIPQFWAWFAFIGGLTYLTLLFILLGEQLKPSHFTQLFLIATIVKILFCLIFILIFILNYPVNKVNFGLNFFYLYFLNMGFEVYVLLRNLRNQNLK